MRSRSHQLRRWLALTTVIGAVAALVMAMAEVDHFWIANAVYLAFLLSALLSSTAKIAAYRKGFHTW